MRRSDVVLRYVALGCVCWEGFLADAREAEREKRCRLASMISPPGLKLELGILL